MDDDARRNAAALAMSGKGIDKKTEQVGLKTNLANCSPESEISDSRYVKHQLCFEVQEVARELEQVLKVWQVEGQNLTPVLGRMRDILASMCKTGV